jgi:glycosyltransferase involved in cell wall biosynthesis
MIRHEIDGLLIPPEDVDALIAAIDRLLSNNALRRSLATNAKGISLRFSPSSVLSLWNSLLEDVFC